MVLTETTPPPNPYPVECTLTCHLQDWYAILTCNSVSVHPGLLCGGDIRA
jgi:hypothetical protein